jgi:hypothetical protein
MKGTNMSDNIENPVPKQRRSKMDGGANIPTDVAIGSEDSAPRVDFHQGHIRGDISSHLVERHKPEIEEPIRIEAQVTCSIEAAARLYAEGYRPETHLAGLIAFCQSTGLPSFGTVEQMQDTLRAYGYSIRELR